jgi:predicted NBD/HSP70 family sugar kinase
MRAFLADTVSVYGSFVAVGIANLLNLLGLDHVILGGGMMDGFWDLTRARVGKGLGDLVLGRPRHEFGDDRFWWDQRGGGRQDWCWRGAALMAWDDSYFRLLHRLRGS